ncbi:DUF1127 domain-containing protein [Mesorhizobium marinum]|uniref:DUF1127 domain-containing protein n=1 Tax=Mesorhizobium marinum TaxID=3228790 RepID=A0ABV3R330_9HYPH
MATIHAAPTHHAARASTAAVLAVVTAAAGFLRALKNRREIYRLGELSDTQLADIGLTRADLGVVVDLPFVRDPTAHLGVLAEARQREVEALARQVA